MATPISMEEFPPGRRSFQALDVRRRAAWCGLPALYPDNHEMLEQGMAMHGALYA